MNPWERYATEESGPWAKYAQPEAPIRPAESSLSKQAAEIPWYEALAIGAGRSVDRGAAGLKQGALGIGAVLSEALPGSLKQRAQGAITDELTALEKQMAEADRLYKPLAEEHPMSTFVGEAAPYVAAPVRGGAEGAALLAAQEYGNPKERATRAGLAFGGTKVGEAVAAKAAKTIQPKVLAEAQTTANAAADKLGVKLTAGEASGNKALRWAETASADMPFAAGIAKTRREANDAAIAFAAGRSIGVPGAKEITPDVLALGRKETSVIFDDVLSRNRVTLDAVFRSEVSNITGSNVMKELRDDSVEAMLGQFRNMPPGKIQVSGQWFQENKTALNDAVTKAYRAGETGKARALEKFERALDDAASRSMPKADREAYDLARRQWANLRILETGNVVKDGRVMPAALDQAFKTRYKAAYKEGKLKGDLVDIAKLGSTLRELPQSGTVPRAIYGGLPFTVMEPTTAAMTLAVPSAVQGLLGSKAGRSMATGGMKLSPEAEQFLLRAGAAGGFLPAVAAE